MRIGLTSLRINWAKVGNLVLFICFYYLQFSETNKIRLDFLNANFLIFFPSIRYEFQRTAGENDIWVIDVFQGWALTFFPETSEAEFLRKSRARFGPAARLSVFRLFFFSRSDSGRLTAKNPLFHSRARSFLYSGNFTRIITRPTAEMCRFLLGSESNSKRIGEAFGT